MPEIRNWHWRYWNRRIEGLLQTMPHLRPRASQVDRLNRKKDEGADLRPLHPARHRFAVDHTGRVQIQNPVAVLQHHLSQRFCHA